MPANWHRPLR